MVVLPVRTSSKVRVPSMRVASAASPCCASRITDWNSRTLCKNQDVMASWKVCSLGLLKSASYEEASLAHLSMNVLHFRMAVERFCVAARGLLVPWLLRLRHRTFRCPTETFAHLGRNFRVLLGRQLRRTTRAIFLLAPMLSAKHRNGQPVLFDPSLCQ